MRFAIFLFFILIQSAGIFSGIKIASGNDLRVSFENEVAGISPGMTLLPKGTGNLVEPGFQMAKAGDSNSIQTKKGGFSYPESRSKLIKDPYASAGFISNNMVPVGKVAKIFDNKLATSGPERVFIDLGKRQGLELGDKFTVYSQERFIYHPVIGKKRELWSSQPRKRRNGSSPAGLWSLNGKPLGYRIQIRGVLEVVEIGETVSYANVIQAYADIKPGEPLIPYQEMVEPSFVNSDDNYVEGYIVATKTDKIGVALTDIVYIDKGWQDSVHAGQVFEVYHVPEIVEKPWYQVKSFGLKKTPLLPDILGEIKVVNTQKHTATAVIVQSNYDMHEGNKIRTKR